ncbi:MAG: PAS domain S-box protein [Kiritimatiellia bacterium]
MTETTSSPGFKFFRQLNTVDDRSWLGSKTTFTLVTARRYFPSDSRQDRLARALGAGAAGEEVLECCEFFEHPPGDAGAGGGRPLLRPRSAGPALPLFEKETREVHLLDERIPPVSGASIDCVAGLAPWVAEKLRPASLDIGAAASLLPAGASIVSAHACGVLTDACIDLAIRKRGAVGVLPCCHPERLCPAPPRCTGRWEPASPLMSTGPTASSGRGTGSAGRRSRPESPPWTGSWSPARRRTCQPQFRMYKEPHAPAKSTQPARKSVESIAALKESLAFCKAAINTAVDGIIIIDAKGLIRDLNITAERLFEFTRDEMMGNNVCMLMPEPFRSQHDRFVAHFLKTGEKKVIGIRARVPAAPNPAASSRSTSR